MLDIGIFVVFLVVNFIVGMRYRGNKQSFKEYAIGDKNFLLSHLLLLL